MDKIPLGTIDLRDCRTIIREISEDKKGNTKNFFRICGTNKDYEIDAGTSFELESWMSAVAVVINHYSLSCTIK